MALCILNATPAMSRETAATGSQPIPSDSAASDTAMTRGGPMLRPSFLALPAVLSEADRRSYRAAFAAAGRGEIAAKQRALEQIRDRRLVPHVEAAYFLAADPPPSLATLSRWLRDNADHPDGPAIHALAARQTPKGKRHGLGRRPRADLAAMAVVIDSGPGREWPAPPGRGDLSAKDRIARDRMIARVSNAIRAAHLTRAETMLASDTRQLLTNAEIDHFRTRIAAGFFAREMEARAYGLAAAAARRSGPAVPRAHWVAGLAAFATNRFEAAAKHFADLARSPMAGPWDRSAAAFWTARALVRQGSFTEVQRWLTLAAQHPRSFYGLLATRTLGRSLPFEWHAPDLDRQDLAEIARQPIAQRAFMLIEIGEFARAEDELARLAPGASETRTRSLLAIAIRSQMPRLATRLGREWSASSGERLEASSYPVPPWQPQSGFAVDPALIFALIRHESRFDSRAVSPAGAIGLMQIMPKTATMMHGAPLPPTALRDPVMNMTLGQRYLLHLLESEAVGRDLIRLLAAYNAGPQTVIRWKQRREQLTDADIRDDALLAIETLPSPETRHFITRVLYGYWMYSERLGQPSPSLDAVAEGRWPVYLPAPTSAASAMPDHAKTR